MTRFHFERPDGPPDSNVQNPSTKLNSFVPPQGFPEVGGAPQLVATYDVVEGGSLTAIKFNNLDTSPGTLMYIISNTGDLIRQYTLTNPFDVSSGVLLKAGTFLTSGEETVPTGMAWSADGNDLFVTGDSSGNVNQYQVSSIPYDLGDVSTTLIGSALSTIMGTPTGIVFDDVGSKLYVSGASPNQIIRQFSLGTNYSLQGSNTNDGSIPTTPEVTNARSVEFSTDGLTMFLIGRDNDAVFQYDVQNAFNIITGTVQLIKQFSLSGISANPLGLAFSNDGLRMFILDANAKKVFQFTLSSPFQL